MKRFISTSVLIAATAILAGCVGGTTYGTGTSHEVQTLKSVSKIFSIKPEEQAKIDYSARPDLVMPAETASLPQPLEIEQSTSNADWPETPAQRIARIRGEAVQADVRSGNLPLEEQLRKKDGIRVGTPRDKINPDNDGNAFIDVVKNGDGDESKEVKRRRAQLAYSTGAKRKYLTEPPSEYRTPAATAVAGDLGYSQDELDAIEEKAAAEKKARDSGHWIE